MPSNILIIENDVILAQNYASVLNSSLKIKHTIIKSFCSLEEQLTENNFTHLIVNSKVDTNWYINYHDIITLPILVISETETENSNYTVTNQPITYDKIFAFISETSEFSTNSLNDYALGEEDILTEMKRHISKEFQNSFVELPQLIKEKKLEDIKSIVHQISSKFSLLEMNESYKASKQIDTKILDDSENQLVNCENLLVDMAVVINQI